MAKRLPFKLGKEPLLEAVCEVRVSSKVGLHTVLPGYLVAKGICDQPVIEQLAAAQVPDAVRANEPGLRDSPLVSVRWTNFALLIGQRSIAVANPAPYAGWDQFRRQIEAVLGLVLASGFVDRVERYSMKYVNLFAEDSSLSGAEAIDLNLRLGLFALSANNNIQLRAELTEDGFVTVVSVIASAVVQSSTGVRTGAILDIDTVREGIAMSPTDFAGNLRSLLDDIRMRNKRVFFDSLLDEAIIKLEPQYAAD
ncbi:MAG: TIGR04255 family protein [Rubrivivax sp.]|nr:TIGR04255 family protein [Rubrivivax sp.]